jgi:hypothetical protein
MYIIKLFFKTEIQFLVVIVGWKFYLGLSVVCSTKFRHTHVFSNLLWYFNFEIWQTETEDELGQILKVFNLYICWYILFYFVQWNLGTPTWLNKMDKYRRGPFQDVTRFFYAIPKLNHYYRSKTLSHWYCSVLEVFNKCTSSALHKKIFHICCYWVLVCLQCIYFVVEEVSGQLAVYNLINACSIWFIFIKGYKGYGV